MDMNSVLRGIDLFEGLSYEELQKVAAICTEQHFQDGDFLTKEGTQGDEMYIITEGFVEVEIGENSLKPAKVVVSLGSGQIIGEMALLDQGPRSATVRASYDPTIVQVILRQDFEKLCKENTRIGYEVMRNLASDLTFKLRHRNLSFR